MQFTQLSGALFFYSDSGTAATATLYYLVPQGTTPPKVPISFSDSWNVLQGFYIFLEAPIAPGSESDFITAAVLSGPRALTQNAGGVPESQRDFSGAWCLELCQSALAIPERIGVEFHLEL